MSANRNGIALSQIQPVRPDPPEFARWREYPTAIGTCNAITTSPSLGARLSSLSPILFSEDIQVYIIDLENRRGQPRCTSRICKSAADLESVLSEKNADLPRVRVISLHSAKSPLPLKVSEPLMRKILTRYRVDPAFLPVLFSFGDGPHLAESGSNNVSSITMEDSSHNLAYQIRYTEENHRFPSNPWSVRQTGVYHHHSYKNDFDLFILLHPLSESVLERQLLAWDPQSHASEIVSVCENPYRLHILLFAVYIDNWRWYFRFLGEDFEKRNDEVMTLDLKTSAAVTLNFDKVQGLRDLEDTALSLSAHCKSSLRVVEAMGEISGAEFQGIWSLNSYNEQLLGYIEDLSVLTSRIGNTIDLFSYALDLKNQDTAANTNQHVSKLAEDTFHDTAAVKWITYLTLLYLPGSFVASVYGMNLFVFNQQTMKIMIADDFWIYIATWIPLTLLTFLCYALLDLTNKPRQEGGWHWMCIPTLRKLKGP